MRPDEIGGLVFDVDGTLVHRAGDAVHVQPGAAEVLQRIRTTARRLVLFTNGSHAPPPAFAAELRSAGLDVADDEMLTPLSSVQAHLAVHAPDSTVFLFATASAHAYLEQRGVRIVSEDDPSPDVVFVAHPDAADFARLEHAARALVGGAQLLTGSYAAAYAGANGPIFSRGAMVTAALAKASGAEPTIVGKPSPAAVEVILTRLGVPPEQIVVVGDDVTMDVALGRLAGSTTVLVRSGMSGDVDPELLDETQRPHAVVDGVADLLDWL